jgi:hypothetical protein
VEGFGGGGVGEGAAGGGEVGVKLVVFNSA